MDSYVPSPYIGQGAAALLDGHDARQGFCPVCGVVAPCYRARRAHPRGPRADAGTAARGSLC